MSRLRRLILLTILLAPPAVLAGLSPVPAEDVEKNRRALAAIQLKDPAEHARLRRRTLTFLALPEERRAALIKLEHDLRQLGPAGQERLLSVLERYAAWLEILPEAERRQIREAPDGKARLARVRAIREQQWLARLPRAVRDRVAPLQGQARAEALAALRWQQQETHRDWQVAFRLWDQLTRRPAAGKRIPVRLGELDRQEKVFVEEYLRPQLSAKEWQRLDQAQGQWPRFPRVLIELADAHPPALPGVRGPTRFEDLPHDARTRLLAQAKKQPQGRALARLKKQEGDWPGYAVAVVQTAQALHVTLPRELWPAARADLSDGMQRFLDKVLLPVLDGREKALLRKAEGHWPAFPRTIQGLAAGHRLAVPWRTLPGIRVRWDPYRVARPRLPTAAQADASRSEDPDHEKVRRARGSPSQRAAGIIPAVQVGGRPAARQDRPDQRGGSLAGNGLVITSRGASP